MYGDATVIYQWARVLGVSRHDKKHRKRSHKFVTLCNTHTFCCSSPSWNKSISSNSTSSKQKNTKHQFEVSPQKTPKKHAHPPKTTGSSPSGETDRRSRTSFRVFFETQRIGSRRLDLWNAGRGTLVGPGMEAIMDPPRYGSSVAWLGLLGWKRPLGNPSPPAKVPLQREPFLKGNFRIFSAFNHQFSGDVC